MTATRPPTFTRPTRNNIPRSIPSQDPTWRRELRSQDHGHGKDTDRVPSWKHRISCSLRLGVNKKRRYEQYQQGRHDGQSSSASARYSHATRYTDSNPTDRYGIAGKPSYVSSSYSKVTAISYAVNAFQRIGMQNSRFDEYRRYEKKDFKLGTIIRAPLHEEDFNRTSPAKLFNMSSAKSSHISFSDRFGAIYSEDRFLIVVAVFSRHYLAIPLYTYAGTGLKYKDDPGEYASIVDHRHPYSAAESPHVFKTAELKEGVRILSSSSVAHLAYPVPRLYKLHVAHQGRLDEEDTEKMIEIFQSIMANASRNLAIQNAAT
ncbi:hypothetical protein N7G274_002613 [Stereocaulon virgatum]|uniref:DUF6590 domain-containing protein n=1 Tax=Stereocaulon virgatum TaxID=373712 RepID=A0ABR4AIB0_9LECA